MITTLFHHDTDLTAVVDFDDETIAIDGTVQTIDSMSFDEAVMFLARQGFESGGAC